jgi:hypothetical protein
MDRRRSIPESIMKEDTIEVIKTAPTAPQPKRVEISSHLKEHIVATKVKALVAKAGRHAATTTTASNKMVQEKANGNANANVQIKLLTDLVMSLLRTVQDQKEEQMNQHEALTKSFMQQIEMLTGQIETLQAQITEMTEKMETQLSNMQLPTCASPSYAAVARTPLSSGPSNVRSLTAMGTTPSRMTDTLYCTIDTSRVGEEDRSKTHLGAIRKAVEEEIRAGVGQDKWRCAAVIRDGRNMERVRIACRDEAELQRVKEAAQKTAAEGA